MPLLLEGHAPYAVMTVLKDTVAGCMAVTYRPKNDVAVPQFFDMAGCPDFPAGVDTSNFAPTTELVRQGGSLIAYGRQGHRRMTVVLSQTNSGHDAAFAHAQAAMRLPLGDYDFPDLGVYGVNRHDLVRSSSSGIQVCGGVGTEGHRVIVWQAEKSASSAVSIHLVKMTDALTFAQTCAGSVKLRDIFTDGYNRVSITAPGNQRFTYTLSADETPMRWLPLDQETFTSLRGVDAA